MKKILAILCGVTMMFAACTPNDGSGVIPTFPEEQNYEILSGRGQELEFSAEHDWTLSVDYDFAYLKDSEGNNVKSFSGAAGENIKVMVAVEDAIENYDNDIVFHVNMEMEGHTSVLATLTIKKLEYAVQEYEIESGSMRRLQFRATEAWTVSMEENDNAWLEYDSEKEYSFSGTATNELVTIWVKTEAGIKNYDNDIVFSVNRKMGDAEAQEWAKFTIKKIERPAAIVFTQPLEPTVTFEEGGHPTWTEFPNAATKYHMDYSDQYDLEGSMSGFRYNFGEEVSVVVYTYNEDGLWNVPVKEESEDDTETVEPAWVSANVRSGNLCNIVMDLNHETAEYAWRSDANVYESYVNFVNKGGEILASIYCTCSYKPAPSTGGDEAPVSLFSEMAGMMQTTLVDNGGNSYTLTLGMSDLITMPSYAMYAALKIPNYMYGYLAQENLRLVEAEDTDSGLGKYYYVALAEGATLDTVSRENNLTVYCNGGTPSYNITVVFAWVEENTTGGGNTGNFEITLVNEMAGQLGVSLEKMTSGYADYDADWGESLPQYLLTYTQQSPFSTPSVAALNIPGYARYEIYDADHANMFVVSYDSELQAVTIAPNTENGYSSENIPNGKYEIMALNADWTQIARIILHVNVAQ